jgi:PAS domain S-box-containing protein
MNDMFEQLPVAVIAIGSDHKIKIWNRAAEILTGYKADAMIGTDRQWVPFYAAKRPILADLLIDERTSEIAHFYENTKFLPTSFFPGAWEVSGNFTSLKGGVRLLYIIASPVRDEQGRITEAIEIVQDITSRALSRELLMESEKRYRVLCEYVADGVCLLREGRIVLANQSLIGMLGYDHEEDLLGQEFLNFVHDAHRGQIAAIISEKEDNVTEDVFQCLCLKKDTLSIWVEGHHTKMAWEEGKAVLITLRDVTGNKIKEASLEEEKERLSLEKVKLKASIREHYRFGRLIGKSAVMQKVYEQIISASGSRANVIIYGESGTGKELVAREIHDMSERRGNEFVTVHCGAIPESLMESEFFGYRKGAFTGAYIDKHGYLDLANKGTLFLDEVGELGLNIQVKLLRAIEGGGYVPVGSSKAKQSDSRIIAATNRDLMEQVNRKAVRPDFFYRIHVLPITLPPLRDRKDDIPLLVEHFVGLYRQENSPVRLPEKVMEALYSYNWPGNVRELQNVIQRYLTDNKLDFLPTHQEEPPADLLDIEAKLASGDTLGKALEVFEREYISTTLRQHQWKKSKSAASLGVSRKTLFRKMKQYGLE